MLSSTSAAYLKLELEQTVSGPVFLPADPGYAAEVAGHNASIVRRPAIVVGAERREDVAAAVQLAKRFGLPVTIKATGHGSLNEPDGSLMITTSRLRGVVIDPVAKTARVAAGATWGDVLPAAAEHGLTGLAGSHASVGVVGYTLGGGLSTLSRTYGFAADQVRSFEVVTADGALLHVDPHSDADLFWALCGGKGGLAVVTEMTIGLVELDLVYGGALIWSADDAEAVSRAWSEWTTTVPDTVNSTLNLMRMPDLPVIPDPLRGRYLAQVDIAIAATEADGIRLVEPLRRVATPYLDLLGMVPPAALALPDTGALPSWDRGALLSGFGPEAVTALLAEAGPQVESPLMVVQVRHLGGAIARPAFANAAGGRDGAYVAFVLGAPVPELIGAVIPAVAAKLFAALAPFSTGSTLANFVGIPDEQHPIAACWSPETNDRLAAVRRTWNPDAVLVFADAQASTPHLQSR